MYKIDKETCPQNPNGNSFLVFTGSVCCGQESYKLYEPLQIGPYTLQIWSIEILKPKFDLDKVSALTSDECFSYDVDDVDDGPNAPPQRYVNDRPPQRYVNDTPPIPCSRTKRPSPDYTAYPYAWQFDYFSRAHQSSESKFQFNIYKNGLYIEPKEDQDLSTLSWAEYKTPWTSQTFTYGQLCKIAEDIKKKFEPECCYYECPHNLGNVQEDDAFGRIYCQQLS